MNIKKMEINKPGSVVWVQLSNRRWWPGIIKSGDDCPLQYMQELKKEPLAVIKFFHEDKLHHVTKKDQIYSYECSRKTDFIRKGLVNLKEKELSDKFEEDVVLAEKLTGGNMQIVKEILEGMKKKESKKKNDFYSQIGFGGAAAEIKSPRPIITKVESHQRHGFSNISEAILYKRVKNPYEQSIKIEHVTKILEQKLKTDDIRPEYSFKCNICGFSCTRLTVILWHNKAHLKKVENYDSGIRIPGRRKRKLNSQKNKDKRRKTLSFIDHSQTNGHISPKDNSQEAKQLLLDWDDEDEVRDLPNGSTDDTNGFEGSSQDEDDDEHVNSEDDAYDDNYPPPQPRKERQPMPRQIDINSAFDALLADSSPLHNSTLNHSSTYANNDSDSECSDWEKYYNKGSDSEINDPMDKSVSNGKIIANQNGHDKDDARVAIDSDLGDEDDHKTEINAVDSSLSAPSTSQDIDSSSAKSKVKKCYGNSLKSSVKTEKKERRLSKDDKKDNESSVSRSSSNSQPATKKIGSSLPVKARGESSEDHSNQSSSNSSTSSGPAYMLVAVDAQGNNVPMPVLSEGGNHLVAVEASMEDGTTRTLYIDPAHLGPNVDLNNLMLHIDNSGQETVIIPTSNSDGENISPTLIDQSSQDVSQKKVTDGNSKSSKVAAEDTTKKRQSGHAKDEKYCKAITSSGEIKLSKFKKSKHSKPKDKEINTPSESSETPFLADEEVGEDDDYELPDLSSDDIYGDCEEYSPDDMVWVLTHGNWWPSFIVKIHKKERKASILYINCQQKVPIKVLLSNVKHFSYIDYPDMFASQKDKASGLTEAMQMAIDFKKLKEAKFMKETPREFFHLPISEQRTLISEMTLVHRGVPLDLKSLIPTPSSDEKSAKSPMRENEELSQDFDSDKPVTSSTVDEPISDNKLNDKEKQKLELSLKNRSIKNESFISFIQSEACLEHLRGIINGSTDSQRHQDFMHFRHLPYYMSDMNSRYNPGLDFFGINEMRQNQQVVLYLEKQFLDRHLDFLLDQPQKRMYIKLVLFPEAIKHSIRNVAKCAEDDLEDILATGLSLSPIEKKAMRLEYEDFRF